MRLLKAYTITALVSHQTANSAQEDGIKRWKRVEPNKTCNKLGKAAKTCGRDGYCCNANAAECTDEMKKALQKKPEKALVKQCVFPVTERSKKEKNSIKKCLDGYKPSIYSSKHGKLGALCKNLADVVYKFIDRPNYQCSELKRIRKTYFNLVSMKNHCGKKQNKKKQKAQKKAKKAADRQKKKDQKEEDKNRERREDELLDENEEELDESTGIVNDQEASNLDDNIAALDKEQSEADVDHDLAEVFRNQCTNYKNDSNISEEDKSECEEIENLINGVLGDTEEERERNKNRKWIVARIIRVRDGIQSWTNAYIAGECSHRQGQLNTRIKRMGNKIKDVRTKYPTSPKKQMVDSINVGMNIKQVCSGTGKGE